MVALNNILFRDSLTLRLLLLGVFAAGALLSLGCQDQSAGGALAEIDGKPVYLPEFRAQAAFMGLGGDPRSLNPEMRRAVLESMVRQRLVAKRARELAIELTPEELASEEERLRHGLDEGAFETSLAAQGIGYAEWRKMLAAELLVKKTLDLVLASQVRVSVEEVRHYYESHREEFNRPAQVLAQHAVLPTRELAQRLVERVAAGEDMVKASDEMGAPLVDDGDPIWLSRGHMPEALEEKIFSLKPGKLAGPMASDYGFHVVRVLDKKPAQKADLTQAAEAIQRRLTADKMESLAEQWLEDLRGQAKVRFDQAFLESGQIGDSRR
ncbi:hypothetical protein AAU61_19655 [Desulfocarbo indianensis]|nr:hypothetical protein AAU61_19655 [Desulfocarbo indianensis]